MNMSCGGALIHQLKAYGVDTVFGIPGVHTLEFYREMAAAGVRHIGVRHEQGAGFMADGYARVSGRPGTCLLITGPGVTNAATPIGEAFSDSVPLLVISSVNASDDLGMGRGKLHEITNQQAVTAPLTAMSATALSSSQVGPLLARAFASFSSERPRPVHIAVPLDVLKAPAAGPQDAAPRVRAAAPSTEILAAAVALLEAAERPVILAGGGSLDAATELGTLAHKLAAPVITTIAGKGVIPDGHPLSLGGSLQRAGPRAYLAAADLVVAVGTELSAPDLHMWDAQAGKLEARLGSAYEGPLGLALSGKLLRIDIDGAILAGDQRADLVMKADAAEALARLGEAVTARPEAARARAAAEVAEIREGLRDDLTALEKKHVAVLDALRAALPDDGFVCSDMTQIAYTANTTFEARCPRSYFHPVGYGTLGYALPAAIGAKLAAPERAAVALVGDGGLLFTVQELATAAELRQPLAVVLWNNEALGEIEDSMTRQGIPTISVRPETPDFQALARAFNCRACRPESLAAFQEELTAAFAADRPTLIELRQDAAFLP